MLLITISGALAGLVHVLSGPDHLAAVAPLAARDGRRGWLSGWTWGLGHTAGVVCIAAIGVLLRDVAPPAEVISQWSERIVGVALIGLGAWAFRRAADVRSDMHSHGTESHAHLHPHRGPVWLRRSGHAHASFYLGVLHGVAGSSHFLGVLPALALPSATAGLVYVLAFGAASIAGMTAFAGAVSMAALRFAERPMPQRGLMRCASLAAVAVGTYWLLA